MATIAELPPITAGQLEDTDLLYIYRESGGPKDVAMTVAEFARTSLPPVFASAQWGVSDQNLFSALNTWSQLTGWSATPIIDTYDMWDSVNSRFVVQPELEGGFFINGIIRFDHHQNNRSDRFVLSIRKNDVSVAQGMKDCEDQNASIGSWYDSVEILFYDPDGVEDDYYELFCYPQWGGASTDLRIRADIPQYHGFQVCRIAGR